MLKNLKHFFGMRKLKSVIALVICFGVWQIVRIPFPELEPHPIYAYFYAILEMRNSIETQKRKSFARIKASLIGFIVAFSAIALYSWMIKSAILSDYATLIQVAIIIVGVLISLNLAELFNCTTLCAIAAITFIICFWRIDTNPYFYATLRFVQTLLSLVIAFVINTLIFKPDKKS